jgi:MFS family permease
MMARSLLIVGVVATVGLVASGVIGFRMADRSGFELHLLVALVSSLLLLFSHCWILFYLVGTGRAIKDAVAENGLEPEIVAATRRFKGRSSGWAMLAMAFAIAVFVTGGGVFTDAVPTSVHHALFWVTLAVQVFALIREREVLDQNNRLMGDVDRRIAAAAAAAR